MNIQVAWESWYIGMHVKTIEALKELKTEEDQLEGKIIQSLIFFSTQSKYRAEILLEEAINHAMEKKIWRLCFLGWVVKILESWYQIQLNKIIENAKHAEEILTRLNTSGQTQLNNWIHLLYTIKGSRYYYLNKNEKGQSLMIQGLEGLKESKHPWYNGMAYRIIGETYSWKKEPEKALEHLEQALTYFQQSSNDAWEGLTLCTQGSVYNGLDKIELASNLSKKGMEKAEINKDAWVLPYTANCIWTHYMKQEAVEEAIDFFNEKLHQYEGTDFIWGSMVIHNSLRAIYQYKGDMQSALSHLDQKLTLEQKLGHKLDVASTLEMIGNTHREMGEFKLAFKYYDESLEIIKKFDRKDAIGRVLFFHGLTYLREGNLDLALTSLIESQNYSEILESINTPGLILSLIGDIHRVKGNKESALDYYQKSVNTYEHSSFFIQNWITQQAGLPNGWLSSMLNIGQITQQQGLYTKAQDIYTKSLDYVHETKNEIDHSQILFYLILLFIETNDDIALNQYQEQLQRIATSFPRPEVMLYQKLVDALILKRNHRMSQKARALDFFSEISNSPVIHHDLTVFAMLNLSELLVAELKSFGEPEVLAEVKELSHKLQTIGEEQNSAQVQIEALLLQTKLALLEFDMDHAKQLLENAHTIATSTKLPLMLKKITQERQKFEQVFNHWKDFADQNVSMLERIELTEIQEYIADLSKLKPDMLDKLTIIREKEKIKSLLENVLPKEIIPYLQNKNEPYIESFESVSVLFADVVGFTSLSQKLPQKAVVQELNEIFGHFDSLLEKYDAEKIRTIGDNYMVCIGAPRRRSDHAVLICKLALDMISYINNRFKDGSEFNFRIGLNSGSVIGGVIGTKKYHFDIWGDMVNIASRMESTGMPGRIHITEDMYQIVNNHFITKKREKIQVKGKGEIQTFFLLEEKA